MDSARVNAIDLLRLIRNTKIASQKTSAAWSVVNSVLSIHFFATNNPETIAASMYGVIVWAPHHDRKQN